MSVTQAVDAVSHFSQELSGLVELQQLGGRVPIERAGGAAAGMVNHQDVALGVDCYRENLTQVHLSRILQWLRYRLEWNLGSVLLRHHGN